MPLKAHGGVPVYATRLTTGAAADFRPSYSPDGKRIVFSSTRDLNGHSELYWMDAADGRHQLRLTRNTHAIQSAPEGWERIGSRAGCVVFRPVIRKELR